MQNAECRMKLENKDVSFILHFAFSILHSMQVTFMSNVIYALGFFDGVHVGHQALLSACRTLAAERNCEAGVVTFGAHPDGLVLGNAPRLIHTPQLKVGRNFFSQYALDSTSFIEYNERNTLFTWAGYRINHTIELILKQYLEDIEIEECNAIYIVGVTPSDISFVLKQEKPKAVDLASLLVFELKLQYKYDYLLTDELLNMEYAKSCLDIDGAWNILGNV